MGGAVAKVVTTVRDLGTQLNVGKRNLGTTINSRFEAGANMAEKLKRLPFPRPKKMLIVKMLILAKALYGTEAAPASQDRINHLNSTIIKATGYKSKFICTALAHDGMLVDDDLDPRLNMIVRKCTLMRRIVAKEEDKLKDIQRIISLYSARNTCTPAPDNKQCIEATGPVGFNHLRL